MTEHEKKLRTIADAFTILRSTVSPNRGRAPAIAYYVMIDYLKSVLDDITEDQRCELLEYLL